MATEALESLVAEELFAAVLEPDGLEPEPELEELEPQAATVSETVAIAASDAILRGR